MESRLLRDEVEGEGPRALERLPRIGQELGGRRGAALEPEEELDEDDVVGRADAETDGGGRRPDKDLHARAGAVEGAEKRAAQAEEAGVDAGMDGRTGDDEPQTATARVLSLISVWA